MAWWIEREPRGWSSTSMVRVRLPASAPYPRQKRCHLSFDGWMKSVPLVTRGASEGKSCVPAPSAVRPTPPNGSARLATEAMGTTLVELRQALWAIGRYPAWHQLSQEHALLRFDGQYGTGAVLADLAGFSFVMRGP